MNMFISLRNGLCNRLRTLFTFVHFLPKENKYFVDWPYSGDCNGVFSSCFEPLEGFVFIDSIHERDFNRLDVMHLGASLFKNIADLNYDIFENLKPNNDVRNIVKNFNLPEKYNAIHARGTDKTDTIGLFIDSLERFIKESKLPIFLATDDQSLYKKIRKKFGDKILNTFEKSFEEPSRQTTLQRAVADLFICVNAEKFEGTGGSSFTDQILFMRKYPEHHNL